MQPKTLETLNLSDDFYIQSILLFLRTSVDGPKATKEKNNFKTIHTF